MAVTVRKATLKDLDAIHEMYMELTLYESKFDPLLKTSKEWFREQKREYRKWMKRGYTFLIAEDGDTPVGYVCGWVEKAPRWITPKKRGYVCDALVRSEWRKKGTGRKMINQLLTFFKEQGVRWVTLDVYARNASVTAWKNLGFTEHVIEMTRQL